LTYNSHYLLKDVFMATVNLSLVIPVYNEERRLEKLFLALNEYLRNPIIPIVEIIFVDDGSRDGTKNSIIEFQKIHPDKVFLISYLSNQGKGYAVKQGMLRAQGDYILMFDADVSTPLSELNKFIEYIDRGIPIIIGSRKVSGAALLKKQNWLREKMGEAYAVFARLVTGLKVVDFGCGFKAFSKESAKAIFSNLTTRGWIFDTEALLIAKQLGISFKEVGINWTNDEDSRVKIFSGIISSLFGLVYIRLYHSKLWKRFTKN